MKSNPSGTIWRLTKFAGLAVIYVPRWIERAVSVKCESPLVEGLDFCTLTFPQFTEFLFQV